LRKANICDKAVKNLHQPGQHHREAIGAFHARKPNGETRIQQALPDPSNLAPRPTAGAATWRIERHDPRATATYSKVS